MPDMPKILLNAPAAMVLALVAAGPAATPAWGQNAPNSGPSRLTASPVAMTDSAPAEAAAPPAQTYADLVDLALASQVVVKAVVHRQTRLKPEASPGLAPGTARLYIEADTAGVLVGPVLGESLKFLVDVPLDAAGKVPKLKKLPMLLFGATVPGKPDELQLTAADTMFDWTESLDRRVRAVLTALNAPDAPPVITGVREAVHVPGNLVGEGKTQVFFTTSSGKPVSISVLRRPGEPARWGVSFTEIVDQAAQPPQRESLAWYRLACGLPRAIPDKAAISATEADKAQARADYRLVLDQLGPCARNRH